MKSAATLILWGTAAEARYRQALPTEGLLRTSEALVDSRVNARSSPPVAREWPAA